MAFDTLLPHATLRDMETSHNLKISGRAYELASKHSYLSITKGRKKKAMKDIVEEALELYDKRV